MKNHSIDKEFYRALLRLTVPATIQALMLSLVAVADALMLGRIEQNAMAAVTLATQVQFVQNMIFFAVMTATSVLGAQYYGKGDRKTLAKILRITVKIGFAVSVVFFLACELSPYLLMRIFTNEPVLIEIGVRYLRISAFSYLLTGISQSYLTIMKVSDHTKYTAMVSSGAVILNIILNAVFIFGIGGLTAMNERGAALATAITRVVELVVCIGLSLRKDFVRLEIDDFWSDGRELVSDYFKVMLPLLGSGLFWGMGFTSYTAFMGHLGTDAAAANSVAAVVRDMVCCVTDGMAIGGGILVGNELGAGHLDKGKLYGGRITVIAYIIGISSTIVMLLVSPMVVNMVELTQEAVHILRGFMIVLSVYMIGRAVNTIVINGIFSAGGDTLYDMYSLAVCMWCLAVPLAALGTFVFHWPAVVVYACTCLDEVGKIPWTMAHYRKYKWVKDLTRG